MYTSDKDELQAGLAIKVSETYKSILVSCFSLVAYYAYHTPLSRRGYTISFTCRFADLFSPRDVVTISKTLVDSYTLLDVSTSLPRSKHEAAYLRPAPPYVRAHITLLGWCVQLPGAPDDSFPTAPGKARITCMWSWNPNGAWAVGGGVPQHLPSMIVGLVDFVREGSEKVPVMLNYGTDISIGDVNYDTDRFTFTVNYTIVKEFADNGTGEEGVRRQIEFGLSSTQSWDVQIGIKAQQGEDAPSAFWSSYVGQAPSADYGYPAPKRLVLRFAHDQLGADEELTRVNVSIERTSASAASGVRINGIPVIVEPMTFQTNTRALLQETASITAVSLKTLSTLDTVSIKNALPSNEVVSTRNLVSERNIASMIRRNYICKMLRAC